MDGSKQSPENKKGLNKLFIGKNVRKYSDFLTKIRDEKKFQSLAELKTQIKKDIECLE